MNFIFSLLTGIGIYLLLLTGIVSFKVFKKKSTWKEFISIDNIIRISSYLLLLLASLLFIHLRFKDVPFYSVLFLSLTLSLSIVFIPFVSIFKRLKNKEFKNINYAKVFAVLGSLVLIFLEVVVYSDSGFRNESDTQNIPLDSALIVQNTAQTKDGYIEFDQKEYITIDNRELNMRSINLDYSADRETKLQLDIYISYDGSIFFYRKSFTFNPEYETFEYFNLYQYRNDPYIRIVTVIDEANKMSGETLLPVRLNSITINKSFPFIFNGLRFALEFGLLVGVILIFKKGKELRYQETSTIVRIQKGALIIAGIGLLYILINSLICNGNHYVLASSVDGNTKNIFYQLFDAFRKGQLHLDATVSEKLLALENPYDPSARSGVPFLWDRAFYNGKYYCYYGAVPVIFVMFPIYLITGLQYIPSTLLLEEIGVLFSVLAFVLVITEMVKIFFKKYNAPALICTIIAGIFASLLLSNNIYKMGWTAEQIYRIPYAYGLLFAFSMLFFFLRAYRNQKRRMLNLALGGASVVLLMGTRPTMIFTFLFAVPLLVKILLEKYPFKKKLIEMAPMVGIVIVGAVILMIYNYLRFDSILEFGQTYQLTVVNNTNLHYDKKGIIPTIYNFYLMPPTYNKNGFPFLGYKTLTLVEGYHSYNSGGIGLIYFPLFWSIILLPFLFNKKDDLYLRIMFYISPFVIYFLAYTTYCFAGYCPRYMVELTALSALFGVICTYKLFDMVYSYKKITSLISLAIILLSSSWLGINLLFTGFDGWREGDQHGLLLIIRSIFNHYNTR